LWEIVGWQNLIEIDTKSGQEMIGSDIKYGDQTPVWTGIEALVLSHGQVLQKFARSRNLFICKYLLISVESYQI
jgi:hypothetical protein